MLKPMCHRSRWVKADVEQPHGALGHPVGGLRLLLDERDATGGQQREVVEPRAVAAAGDLDQQEDREVDRDQHLRGEGWLRSGRCCTPSAWSGSTGPSFTHEGHWKPTAAVRMQSGQIGRSHRWQRM